MSKEDGDGGGAHRPYYYPIVYSFAITPADAVVDCAEAPLISKDVFAHIGIDIVCLLARVE